ncbi:MAG: SDR family oxidoreductase [Desulfobacterales bacterium]
MRKISVSETLELLVELASRITSIPSVDLPVDAPIGSGLQIRIDQLRQLMKEASQSIGLDCNIDLQPLLDRSLLHIAKILVRISKNDMQERTPKVDLLNEWVRELKIELIEANRPQSPLGFGKRFEDQWPNARVLILSDNPNNHVCQAVWQRLTASGANVQIRSAEEINLTENRVKGAIHRLSLAAVPPPASSGPRRRTALTFVQFGGGYFGTRSSADPITQCCATALAKSVHLERKDLKTRIIDFDPKLEADVIAQKIVVEMEGSEDFSEAGYDDQLCRRTPSVYSLEPAEYALDSTAWSETDVVLVTGGAKGITAECAFALARETKIRMALVGRTSIRDSVTPDPEVEKIHTLLQRYEQNGLKARYYSCDVCDRNSLAETVAQIRREMGKITGVVHGAGLNIPRLIKQVSADQALSEVAPKVIGVLNLLEELSEDPPKLILGLTSIIGITGMAGNSWYAFSNEALDLILRRYEAEHPGIRTLSVAYSIWRDEGMGARMGSVSILKKMGIDAIPTEEGVKRFVRLFTHNPKTHQVIITARLAQFSTFEIQPAPFIKGARYLENLLHFTPGVESAFLTRLSLAEDIYLQDHCYEGSFLFPAVFGLEAMAQVVAHLTGVTDFARLRIENLLLSRPITVDPDKGADIIIWAQKQERHSFENNLCVHAGIFKLGTGSKSDFFSATFVMKIDDSVQKRNLNFDRKTLDIYPKTDLYRKTLLFQGSRFQCIDKVCTLECQNSESGLAIITAAPTDPNYGKLAFAGSDNQKLLLGDPFMRDAILQSAALLIPQDTSLPISIRRWDIYPQPTSMQKDNSIYIQTLFEGKGEDDVHTSVKTFDCNGTLIESLKGYRLRKLQHHQEYPTVSDLVCPDDRDTRELNACLSLLAGKFRVKVPEVCVSYLANLHGLPKDQRRELEIPLIRKVVQQWIKQNNADKTEFTIEWQQTGKPMINLSDELLEVSLSHDNRYCIVVAGSWSLGCDIVPVKHRNRKQWFGLLGQIADTLIDDNLNEKELNRLGSAIWAVKEVLYKVKVKQITSIRIS